MRVFHVVRQFWPSVGGLEDVVGHLARQQMARGWTVEILTLNRIFNEPDKVLAAHEIHAGLEIIRLPYCGSSRYPLVPNILGAIGSADLLHVHAIDFFFDFLAATRRVHGKPLIATTHGGFFHTRAHARLKRVWFDQVTRRSTHFYDAIVACSQADYDLFAPIAAGNLLRIDNGADIHKFAGSSSKVAVKRLATIGRFSINKRLDRLLDAMAQLVEVDQTWQLDIIGAPSDWSLDHLKAEIAARNLSDHVDVTIGASDAAIAALLARASLFVSASEHEGFGLAVIEALSAGLIPIVHTNEAFRALAKSCDLVHLADFSDSADAAAKIEEVFAALRQNHADLRNAAQQAAAGYDWLAVTDHYLDLYRDVMEAGKINRSKRDLTS
ncbi:MAG: glycosyltransferase family 4 protein [Beijerinckiaceae bacterium]